MTYDELNYFSEHRNLVEEMYVRLSNHKIVVNWSQATVLDVAGGGGIQAGWLAQKAFRVICVDIVDNQVRYKGEFVKLLAEKFGRNSATLPIERVEFHVQNAMSLIYKDNHFDFVCSYNAFEHIPNPTVALAECARVLKPGGYLYLTFAPIWTAETGSHFAHVVKEPWAHLLLSNEDFVERMQHAGASTAEVSDFIYAMNRLRLDYYLNLFAQTENIGLKKLAFVRWKAPPTDDQESHSKFAECLNLGYSADELLTNGMYLIFQRE